jgi:hypothetical protein
MVDVVPSGGLDWVEDDSPGPEELAVLREEAERMWRRLGSPEEFEPPARHTIGMSGTWTAEVTQYTPAQVCRVCRDLPPAPGTVCLCCHATRRNPRRHPMQEQATGAAVRERVKAGLRGGRG